MEWALSAAQPVTASTLFNIAQRSSCEPVQQEWPDPTRHVRTGYQAIDDMVLDGAFVSRTATSHGIIAGFAVERGHDAAFSSLMIHKTLATYATTANNPKAFIIDPTGSFDPILLLRLIQQASSQTLQGLSQPEIKTATRKAMNSISVLRVTNMEGIMDALSEIDKTLEQPSRSMNAPTRAPEPRNEASQRDEIPDSDDDGDAILSPPPSPAREPSAGKDDADPAHPLLIIPSAHQIFTDLLRGASARGHALSAHFRRRLRGLAASHNATVLLFNVTVGAAASAEQVDGGGDERAGASAFALLAAMRPALGRTYASVLDLSVLAAQWRGHGAREGRWSVEVLFDGVGKRRGRWVMVDVRDEEMARVWKGR